MGWRILVLDDDEVVLRGLRRVLERAQHQVRPCTTIEAARFELAKGPIDLLIVDLDLGGTHAGELIRQVETVDRIPIIILSGWFADRRLAAHRQLEKPIGSQALLDAVAEEMARHQMRRVSQRRAATSDL